MRYLIAAPILMGIYFYFSGTPNVDGADAAQVGFSYSIFVKSYYSDVLEAVKQFDIRCFDKVIGRSQERLNCSVYSTAKAVHYLDQLQNLGFSRVESVIVYDELTLRGVNFPGLKPFVNKTEFSVEDCDNNSVVSSLFSLNGTFVPSRDLSGS